MFDSEKMEEIMLKCKNDPELAEVFENLIKWSQICAMRGMKMDEMAAICTLGYVVGQDPSLQKMIENLIKINQLNLDIV